MMTTQIEIEKDIATLTERLYDASIRIERIEERAKYRDENLQYIRNVLDQYSTNSAVQVRDIKNILEQHMKQMQEEYVRKIDYEPVKRLVYGFVAAALLAFGALLLTMVTRVNVTQLTSTLEGSPSISSPASNKK